MLAIQWAGSFVADIPWIDRPEFYPALYRTGAWRVSCYDTAAALRG